MNSQETLTHVHDWLNWRRGSRLIDDRPATSSFRTMYPIPYLLRSSYQTSCRCPATLFAGRKGSGRAAVADIALAARPDERGAREKGRKDREKPVFRTKVDRRWVRSAIMRRGGVGCQYKVWYWRSSSHLGQQPMACLGFRLRGLPAELLISIH